MCGVLLTGRYLTEARGRRTIKQAVWRAVLDGINAVRAVGVADRDDFYWALHAVFVSRARHRELFDQAATRPVTLRLIVDQVEHRLGVHEVDRDPVGAGAGGPRR